jgi:hypothetical protein
MHLVNDQLRRIPVYLGLPLDPTPSLGGQRGRDGPGISSIAHGDGCPTAPGGVKAKPLRGRYTVASGQR